MASALAALFATHATTHSPTLVELIAGLHRTPTEAVVMMVPMVMRQNSDEGGVAEAPADDAKLAGIGQAAANSAMLGLSRLAYSLSTNRQIPSGLGRLHPQRSTPYVLILLAGAIAAGLVVPEDLDFLVGIYTFGAMLAFTIAHVSVCRLRYREPERERPYRVPLSVQVRGRQLPLPAVLGALVSAAGWVAVMVVHEPARYVGLGWMTAGLALYVIYRRADETSLLRRVTVAPEVLRAEPPQERDYGSVLVPIFGTDLDGIELRASDLDWTLGSGTPLEGAAADLLLVLCGRTLPPGRLTGEPSARFSQPGPRG